APWNTGRASMPASVSGSRTRCAPAAPRSRRRAWAKAETFLLYGRRPTAGAATSLDRRRGQPAGHQEILSRKRERRRFEKVAPRTLNPTSCRRAVPGLERPRTCRAEHPRREEADIHAAVPVAR